jgi:hypothetical protein
MPRRKKGGDWGARRRLHARPSNVPRRPGKRPPREFAIAIRETHAGFETFGVMWKARLSAKPLSAWPQGVVLAIEEVVPQQKANSPTPSVLVSSLPLLPRNRWRSGFVYRSVGCCFGEATESATEAIGKKIVMAVRHSPPLYYCPPKQWLS